MWQVDLETQELKEIFGGIPFLNHHLRWPRRFGPYKFAQINITPPILPEFFLDTSILKHPQTVSITPQNNKHALVAKDTWKFVFFPAAKGMHFCRMTAHPISVAHPWWKWFQSLQAHHDLKSLHPTRFRKMVLDNSLNVARFKPSIHLSASNLQIYRCVFRKLLMAASLRFVAGCLLQFHRVWQLNTGKIAFAKQ